ncbi:MAG: glycosyltransferase [Bacillota bacterium]|nr:glycosyltransferase [Bacillota bacterium]
MVELSVIVPVYNVEKYVAKCIDSILSQTYTDFELILIDDGSTDQSGTICDLYKEKDERIIVIHQKNQGVSVARNAGLDISKGTYITFVDSDDWIEPEMYEVMISTLKEKNVDMIACGINHYSEEKEFLFSELKEKGSYISIQILSTLFAMPNPIGGCIWNKVYKRENIASVRYLEGMKMVEDRMYLFSIFQNFKSAIKIPDCFYNVTERSLSATHIKNISVPCNMIRGSYQLLKCAKKHSKEIYALSMDKFLDDCLVHIPRITEIGKISNKGYKIQVLKYKMEMFFCIIICWIGKVLPKNKIHGYLYGLIKM